MPRPAERITQDRALVTVMFVDGEVAEYIITATHKISSYLVREATATGVLSMYNDEESYGIPVQHIRSWTIQTLTSKEEPNAY